MTLERAQELRVEFSKRTDQSCSHRVVELLRDHGSDDVYICTRCGAEILGHERR